MGSLQGALMGVKGKLSGIDVRPQISEEEIEQSNTPKEKLFDHFSIEDLDNCSSMRKFKEMAEKILLAGTGTISEIVRNAHRFKDDSKPENKSLSGFSMNYGII